MADISKITLPSGSTYNIKDETARSEIEALSGYTVFLGVTTTAITDGSTTNPVTINESSVTATTGGIVTYGSAEFVWNGSAWQEFGDLSALGSLAYKDSASGSFTPSGTVGIPTITVTLDTTTVNSITAVGSLPSATMPVFTATVSNENLTIGWTDGSFDAGTLPTKGSATTVATGVDTATSSRPSFSGTSGTVTVS